MRLTRSQLKQIQGVLWRSDEESEEKRLLMSLINRGLKNCAKGLHSSTVIEFDEAQEATIKELKQKYNIR